MARPDSYSTSQKLLHWVLFGLVAVLYLLTYGDGLFPRGSAGRAWAWWLHISFGLLLAGLVIARIGMRITRSVPAPPADMHGWARRLASVTHLLLYFLLIALPIAGVTLTWARGDFARQVLEVHGLLANTIIFIAAGHAAAALWHHFVLRDGVLNRMLPGRGRRAEAHTRDAHSDQPLQSSG